MLRTWMCPFDTICCRKPFYCYRALHNYPAFCIIKRWVGSVSIVDDFWTQPLSIIRLCRYGIWTNLWNGSLAINKRCYRFFLFYLVRYKRFRKLPYMGIETGAHIWTWWVMSERSRHASFAWLKLQIYARLFRAGKNVEFW